MSALERLFHEIVPVQVLEAPWPSLAFMEDGDDLEAFASHPVRNQVGCPGNYEFSRTGHSAGSPKTRQLG